MKKEDEQKALEELKEVYSLGPDPSLFILSIEKTVNILGESILETAKNNEKFSGFEVSFFQGNSLMFKNLKSNTETG